jgi:uncharacterized FlaG/YvyC family protein
MEVRPVSVSSMEPKPVPAKEEGRAHPAALQGQMPPEADVKEDEWVKPVDGSEDIRAFTEHLAEAVNEALKNMRYSLEFVVEQKDRSLTVRVLDSEGEVIREIPPEEIRNLQKRLLEMMGVLFDQKEGS